MKKYGFTLAELLVTLGIIGVVASLATPVLISHIQNSSNGARLSATVAALENAFTSMLVKEDADTFDLLFDTEAWRENGSNKNAFAGSLSKYLDIAGTRDLAANADAVKAYYGAGRGPFVLNANGSKGAEVNDQLAGNLVATNNNVANGNHVLILKNGATVFLIINNQDGQYTDDEEDVIQNNGGGITSIAADVWIDVNGTAAPNTLGRDIFAFYLGKNGKLYPLGGKDVAIYDAGTGADETPNFINFGQQQHEIRVDINVESQVQNVSTEYTERAVLKENAVETGITSESTKRKSAASAAKTNTAKNFGEAAAKTDYTQNVTEQNFEMFDADKTPRQPGNANGLGNVQGLVENINRSEVLDDNANNNANAGNNANNTLDTWNNANSDRRCLNGNIAGGGYGCTGRVVEDGYKIRY